MSRIRDWFMSYWVTYVELSRADRREIVRRMADMDNGGKWLRLREDGTFEEVERP